MSDTFDRFSAASRLADMFDRANGAEAALSKASGFGATNAIEAALGKGNMFGATSATEAVLGKASTFGASSAVETALGAARAGETALAKANMFGTVNAVDAVLGKVNTFRATSAAETALGKASALGSSSTLEAALGAVRAGEAALVKFNRFGTLGAVDAVLGKLNMFGATSAAEAALGKRNAFGTTRAIEAALGKADMFGTVGAIEAALGARSIAEAVFAKANIHASNKFLDVFTVVANRASFAGAKASIVSVPNFDASSFLDPASDRSDIKRGVEQILSALQGLADNVSSSPDDTECAEREQHQGSPEHSSPHEQSQSPHRQGRLWVPTRDLLVRSRPDFRAPGERQSVELAPIDVFVGGASVDERHRNSLLNHMCMLVRRGIIRPWHEGNIVAGEDRESSIWANLQMAKLILLLISADYVAELCRTSMWDKIAARAQKVKVVPVLVRPFESMDDPIIARLRSLPSDGRPVTAWPDADAAWADVARGIRSAIEDIRRASMPGVH